MMEGLVAASIRARGLVVALAILVLGLGALQLNSMPVDVLPEFGETKVEVRTEALGLSAYEVEQLITAPMEQNLLNNVAFLEDISSKSIPSLSSVELVFEDGTDPFDARQVVQEQLTEASKSLPNVSRPPQMLQPLSATGRVMMVGLKATDIDLLDMSVLARWTIRPQLMGVPGVSNVVIWGQRDQQLQVLVDPARLQVEGVTLDQVIATAGNALWASPLSFLEAAAPGRGGFIDTPAQRLGVQHINPILTADDLARVAVETPVVASTEDEPAPPAKQLGQIADVVEGHQPLIGDGVVADGTGLMLVIEKLPGANAVKVTEGIEDELAKLAPGLEGIEIESSIFRPATYIETSRDNMLGLLLIGLGLGVLALAALTFSWRSVVISVVSAAVSLAGALLVLAWWGETLNVMILAGLVLAITVIIDDVVDDRASISASLAEGETTTEPTAAAAGTSERLTTLDATGARILRGASAIRSPLGYATVALLLMLVSFFVLTGESDAFLSVIARSFGIAILVSIIVAMTVTPALSRVFGPAPGRPVAESPIAAGVSKLYAGIAAKVTATPAVAYVALVAVAAIGLGSMAFLERPESLVPRFEDTDLLVRWEGPTGTSLPEMNRISTRVSQELRGLSGIDNVGAHTGRAVLSDDIGGANAGELWVSIDPSADYDETLDAVKEVVNGYPGINRGVTEYSTDRIADGLEATAGDVTVRVFGQEYAVLEAKADELARGLRAIDGVSETTVEQLDIEPTVEVNVDLTAAERAGIKPGDVRRLASTYIQGLEVGSLFVDQKVFDVIVQGVPEVRTNLSDIGNLQIDTPASGLVRLADLAAVTIAPNPSVIKHEAVVRSIDVHANVDGDPQSVLDDVDRVIAGTSFPVEHHAEVLGQTDARNSSRNRFIFVMIGIALAVFLLLQAAFASWKLATAIFVTLPTAAAGGALAAWLGGGTITIGSVVGFVAVLGIALRFTMVLIRRFQHPDADDPSDEAAAPTRALVISGACERVIPIVTTVIVGIVVLLPILVMGPQPGSEIVHPMAVVLIGGLITAALFALLIVPTLYLQFAPASAGVERVGRRGSSAKGDAATRRGGGGGGGDETSRRSRRSSRHQERTQPPFEPEYQNTGLEELS